MTEHAPTFPAENSPRAPTSGELAELWQWLKAKGYADDYLLQPDDWMNQFWIAVFDNYMTGCPGYAGKLMYLIWDGFPDACTVFIWQKGRLRGYAQHADCEGSSIYHDDINAHEGE